MQNTVKNLDEAITESIVNLSDILDYFKEYVDVAIFTPARFQSVKLYNIAATDILGEMEILFNDIIYQLSNHQAKSVDDIVSSSRSVLANMELLKEDIERGATYIFTSISLFSDDHLFILHYSPLKYGYISSIIRLCSLMKDVCVSNSTPLKVDLLR